MESALNDPIKSSEVMAFFPTFVWKFALTPEVFEPLNEQIKAKLGELLPENSPIPLSNVWQTEQNLHTYDELKTFTRYVGAATRGVLEFMKVVYESFAITGCWANVAIKGGWHRAHSHPNNFLSGVYYVQAPQGANTITFKDPRIQRSVLEPRLSHMDESNAGEVTLEVREGLMLMFPSWLEHSVGFNTSDVKRISVSFNIMFNRFGETMSQPRWQHYARQI